MAKEKRLKNKEVKIRVVDDIYLAFSEFVKENNTTRTKVIEDFLKELLKDKLKRI
jgi:hypothetical protein